MKCDDALEFIVADLEGKLLPSESAALSEHFATCEACRLTAAECREETWARAIIQTGTPSQCNPPPSAAGGQTAANAHGTAAPVTPADFSIEEVSPGTRWGRYVVLERIGSGGMGVVYAAYDSVLDRRVALKLLLEGPRPAPIALQGRLLREAKAMAQLSHPNVVTVHDAGTLEGRFFVSMEYVDGVTVSRWLRQSTRSWREILAVFVEAAQGLAAAHAAGLVHRDFTPANVLIGSDGRVRVTDFGLARLVASDPSEASVPLATQQAGADSDTEAHEQALRTPLTRDSQIVGTPPYMSPEQHVGDAVTARSDQFSFCVALYEALYGERPFAPRSLDDLLTCSAQLDADRKPPARPVPTWLRRVVLRGLRPNPEARYPSMEALVSALLRGRVTAPRRGLTVAAGLLALMAVVYGSSFLTKRGNEDCCRRGTDHLQGVWDAKKQATIQHAFATSGVPMANDAWNAVKAAVDTYSSQWLAMHYDTCAATHIRHEQSEHVLDLRMGCLRERLKELSSLIRLYEVADGDVVKNAVAAAEKMSRLAVCADGVALATTHAPPADADTRFAVENLRDRIAGARNLGRVGKPLEAIEKARVLASEAKDLGYLPVVAESLQLVGELEMNLQQLDASQSTLRRAVQAAEAAGHDAVKALAWIQLAHVARQLEGESGTADTAIALAAAVLERNKSLKEIGVLLHSISGLRQLDKGNTKGALESLQQAVTLGEELFGPSHPRVASLLRNMGEVYCSTGDDAKALAAFRRSTTILEQSYGVRSPLAAAPLAGLAQTLLELGRVDEALTHLRRQLDDYERAYGQANGRLAKTHSLIGKALALQGQFDAALEHHNTAASVAEAAYGPRHWRVGRSLRYMGHTLLMQGNNREALKAFRKGWTIFEPQVQQGDVEPAHLLAGIGRAYLATQQPRAALEPLRRAIDLWQQAGNQSPRDLARARFAYARALDLTGTDTREALELARSALEVFREGGPATANDLAEVRAWLAERKELQRHGLQPWAQ